MALWLGCLFPLDRPVKVLWSRSVPPDCLGECLHNRRTQSFEVRLRPGLSGELALTTLIHEWAHARTMLGLQEDEDYHSDRFWIVLGEITQRWKEGGHRAAARLTL